MLQVTAFALKLEVGSSLTRARAEYNSTYGKIISHWKIEGDQFICNLVIPANISADVVTHGAVMRYEAGEYEIKTRLK